MIILKNTKNEQKKENHPQNQHYVQDYELVSLLFPFPEQTLSIYLNGCKTEKQLILFHLDLSISYY